jgi:cysteinyl-tRNA synthetase
LLLNAHYRETFNFTLEGLEASKASLLRLDECLGKLRELAGSTSLEPEEGLLQSFSNCLDDDLNISGAWGSIFEWVREMNRRLAENSVSKTEAAAALATWNKLDSVLGVGAKAEVEIPPDINALLEARQAARKAKDFKRSDAIRDELKAKGWIIEDTPKGPRLKKL